MWAPCFKRDQYLNFQIFGLRKKKEEIDFFVSDYQNGVVVSGLIQFKICLRPYLKYGNIEDLKFKFNRLCKALNL